MHAPSSCSMALLLQCGMHENHSPPDAPAESPTLYADIIVPRHLAGPFTYRVPERLKPVLRVGHLVVVPFGRSRVQGAVIALRSALPHGLEPGRIKEMKSLTTDSVSTISSKRLELAKRIADHYVAPWGQCLRLITPPTGAQRSKTARFKLTDSDRNVLADRNGNSRRVRSLPKGLADKPADMPASRPRSIISGERTLKAAAEQGLPIENCQSAPASDATEPLSCNKPNGRTLNREGISCEESLFVAIENRRSAKLVLQAPLSQRLSMLQQAIGHTVAQGRTVLILVGEAERARWLTEVLLRDRTTVSVCLHSGLSDASKKRIWEQAEGDSLQVVVGTRSAVFLPLRSLGMIWIEGEEDPALKEPQEPRYHAREIAWFRAQDEGALMVLSSLHPSLESRVETEAHWSSLRQDPQTALRPAVQVSDLRWERTGTILGAVLIEATRETIRRNGGVLLFLNRKGYAGALACRDCGEISMCVSCRVALTYYRHPGRLSCSYCGTAVNIPEVCGSCAGSNLQMVGKGTERVEEEVRRLFPMARLIRADGDTMKKPSQAAAVWAAIKDTQWDILIGTQLLLRDHAVPPVSLVGAVLADASLSLPDFRAAERTYHLLLDAASLARPASEGGRMIIQTFLPVHHAIQAVVQHEESIFTSEELAHRRALKYPPAVHLIALQISGMNDKIVEEAAVEWVRLLNVFPSTVSSPLETTGGTAGDSASDGYQVLGPIPPRPCRLKGRYRRQILVKSLSRDNGVEAVRKTVRQLERTYPPRQVKFDVDVDPVDMW